MEFFKVIDNPLDDCEKLKSVCEYIYDGKKDNNPRNCVGRGVSPDSAYEDMNEMLDLFDKNKGRRGYHFVVSFAKDAPLGDSDYMQMGMEISDYFFPKYQVLFARHKEKEGMEHLHFLVNTASLNGNPKLHLGYTAQAELDNYIHNVFDEFRVY